MSQQVIEAGYEVIQERGEGGSAEGWRKVSLDEVS
jgi:hypothetical protein